jgi:hypothetical protein
MRSIAKWGAIIGVAIYLISQAIYVIGLFTLGATPVDPSHPTAYALGCLDLLLIAFAFSAAGFYTGRETGVAGYGALAGMLTFAVYGLLLAVIPFGARVSPLQGGTTVGQDIVIGIISVGLYLAIAALIGWLGGRPGASRSKAASPANDSSAR